MDSTQLLTGELTDMAQLSNWDRILLLSLNNMKGGRIQLTLSNGDTHLLGNGEEEAELIFHERSLAKDLLLGGSMVFAECYMRGEWSTNDLSALLRIFGRSQQDMGRVVRGTSLMLRRMDGLMHKLRSNTKENARKNIQEHYDLSNELYETFLDPTLTYSSAIFAHEGEDLEKAQLRKIDRLIEQLNPQSDDHVLEIGSGWGACAIRLAQLTGCRVTSLTLSDRQAEEARRRVEAAGLSGRVEIRLQDYRDVEETYDHVISVEMIEAVGHDFLEEYYETVNRVLKSGGHFALQAITIPNERYQAYNQSVDFIRKHIFPGGHLPSPQMLEDLRREHSDLKLVDQFEFGHDYAETLRRWCDRFLSREDEVKNLGFDDVFIRKWQYYLCYCEAGFDTGLIHVRQYSYQKL